MNGYIEKDGQKYLWVAKKSKLKPTYPGMCDHLLVGGLGKQGNRQQPCWVIMLEVSISFDILFILQHYVFYPSKKKVVPSNANDVVSKEPLLESSENQRSGNV